MYITTLHICGTKKTSKGFRPNFSSTKWKQKAIGLLVVQTMVILILSLSFSLQYFPHFGITIAFEYPLIKLIIYLMTSQNNITTKLRSGKQKVGPNAPKQFPELEFHLYVLHNPHVKKSTGRSTSIR